MKTIGDKIRDMRIQKGLTQQELADRIGVTIRSITSYEAKGIVPRVHTIAKLAEALGVSTAFLTNDSIEDPAYGLEESPYVESARASYGNKGADELEDLLNKTTAMLAGGDVPEEDKELFYQAISEAYFANRRRASERFTRKDYRKK